MGNAEHRFLALEQLREMKVDPASVILEPVGRNTAPALTLAALAAREKGADPILVVSPADQTVTDHAAFTAALQAAVRGAADGAIVILGITPSSPETAYGYIRSTSGEGLHKVAQFVEKPDAATAARYLAEGGYTWNSGMFVLRASVWLKALEQFRPDILAATQAAWSGRTPDERFIRPTREAFLAVPSESVDYAVMERCPGSAFDIRMVPLDAGWNDLGAWDAVWQVAAKDASGNSGVGDVMFEDSRRTRTCMRPGRLVAVARASTAWWSWRRPTPSSSPIAQQQPGREEACQSPRLGENAIVSEHALHRKVHRPWGWYDSIDNGRHASRSSASWSSPGPRLSLQMHHHRAEHWIVVSGHGRGHLNGDRKVVMLSENQSTYIPLGADGTGSPTPARCRSRSSKCSRVPISARTTSSASRIPMAVPAEMARTLHAPGASRLPGRRLA